MMSWTNWLFGRRSTQTRRAEDLELWLQPHVRTLEARRVLSGVPPMINPILLSTNEDTPLQLSETDFLGAYTDPEGDPMQGIIISAPTNGTLTYDGGTFNGGLVATADIDLLTFVPAENFHGSSVISWQAQGGGANSAPSTLLITVTPVQDPPTVSDSTLSATEDDLFSFTLGNFTGNFSDPDGDPLDAIIISDLPTNGTLTLSGIDVVQNQLITRSQIGDLKYLTDLNFNGTDSFEWQALAAGGPSNVATLTLDVAADNDAPELTNKALFLQEDNTYTFSSTTFSDLFLDVDGDSLTQVRIDTLPTNGTLKLGANSVSAGQVIAVGQLGNLTYEPDLNYFGPDSFTWSGSDGTVFSDNSASMMFNITPLNDVPSVSDSTITATEEASKMIPSAEFINHYSDPEGAPLLSIRIQSLPTDGTLTLGGGGTLVTVGQVLTGGQLNQLRYRGDKDFFGTDSFTWTASEDGTNFSTVAATLSIQVANLQDPPLVTDSSISAMEDTAYDFGSSDFNSNFHDVDGDSLVSVKITDLPGDGTLTLDGTAVTKNQVILFADLNKLKYTPDGNFNGSDTIEWQGSDGTNFSSAATITLAVAAANDLPTVTSANFNADEDTPLSFTASDFTDNFDDVDGDALDSITITDLPDHGTLQLDGVDVIPNQVISAADLGNLTYQGDQDYNGTDSFQWTASDGTGSSTGSATFTLNIADTPDLPVADNSALAVVEETTYTFSSADFSGFYSDVDGDTLASVQIVTLPAHGTLQLAGVDVDAGDIIDVADLGDLTYLADDDFDGTDTFTWKAVNDAGETSAAAATMSLQVTGTQDPPTVSDVTMTATEEQAYTFTAADFEAGFSDPDSGDTLQSIRIETLSINNGTLQFNGIDVTANQVIVISDIGMLVYLGDMDFFGTDSFTWVGSDGTAFASTPATATIDVQGVNDAPVTGTASISVDEEDVYTFTASDFSSAFSDVDPGDSLTQFRIDSLPTSGTLLLDGVAVGVNQIIVLADIPDLTYQGDDDFFGSDSFRWSAHDGTVFSANKGTMNITVNPVQDPPTVNDSTVIASEEVTFTFAVTDFTDNFADVDGDSLTQITVASLPTHGTLMLNGVALEAGDTIGVADLDDITYLSDDDFFGTDSFQWIGNDGTEDATANATLTIQVANTQDAPEVSDVAVDVVEDTPHVFTEAEFAAGFSDVDNDTITAVQIVSLPTNGVLLNNGVLVSPGEVIDIADIGLLQYIPFSEFNGTDSFTWRGSDGLDPSATAATMTLNVSEVNNAPIGGDDTFGTAEGDALTLTDTQLLANDAAGPSNESDQTLTLISVSPTSTNGGTVTLDNGEIVYTPATDYYGQDSFTYDVQDNGTTNGAADPQTTTVTVYVNVVPVNDPPVAGGDTLNAVEDRGSVSITVAELLSNDSAGPLNEILQLLSVGSVDLTSDNGGTITFDGLTITYTPPQDFFGTDTFQYQLFDDGLNPLGGPANPLSSFGTVTVIVAEVNDAPVAGDDTFQTAEEAPLTIATSTLLSNDNAGPGEAAQLLNVISVTATSAGGTVQLVGGNVVFTPDDDFVGTFTFEYVLADNGTTEGLADPLTTVGTVSIEVTEVNDPPVTTDDVLVANEDQVLTLDLSALTGNDSVGPNSELGQVLTVTQGTVTTAQGGTVQLTGTQLIYTPPADFYGTDTFEYTVTDNGLTNGSDDPRSSVGTATIQVAPVNDVPVTVDDFYSVKEDNQLNTPSSTGLLNNDAAGPTNESLQSLQVISYTAASHGTVVVNPDGSFTYTPNSNFSGTDSFTYTIQDNGVTGANADPRTTMGVATITVTPLVDPPMNLTPTNVRVVGEEGRPTQVVLSGQLVDIDGSENLGFFLQNVPANWVITSNDATITRSNGELTIQPFVIDGNGLATVTLNVVAPNESRARLTARTYAIETALEEGAREYAPKSDLDIEFVNVAPTVVATATEVSTDSITTLTFQVTDPGVEDPLRVTIDWRDGKTESFLVTQAQRSITHFYATPPDPNNPAAPIDIIVKASDGVASSQVIARADVPPTGIMTLSVDTTPDFAITDLTPVDKFTVTLDTRYVTPIITQPVGLLAGAGESKIREGFAIVLREVGLDGGEGDNIPLPEDVLKRLRLVFGRLPDGHYRMYMLELGTERERMVFDLFVRQGRAVNPLEDFEGTGLGPAAIANKQLVPQHEITADSNTPKPAGTEPAVGGQQTKPDPAAADASTGGDEKTTSSNTGRVPATGAKSTTPVVPAADDGAALEVPAPAVVSAAGEQHPWSKMARRLTPAATLVLAATASAEMARRRKRPWSERVEEAFEAAGSQPQGSGNPLSRGARWRRKIARLGKPRS